MTWEETIISIRKQPEYAELVEKAYFGQDLVLNVERFKASEEYLETKRLIQKYRPGQSHLKVLDVGSGNGISAVSFALDGFDVTAVEPDKSDTVGSGAIRKLIQHYELNDINVVDTFGEKLPFDTETFDVVYIRQAMHHANNLKEFVREATRVLKKGGLLLTIRDHVIFNEKDKAWFLESHPLHKFYGGENAYTPEEYKKAMDDAGLSIKAELKYYDSIINYFPITSEEIHIREEEALTKIKEALRSKIGLFSKLPFLVSMYKRKMGFPQSVHDETKIPGRMYSYIAIKL